MWKKSEGGAPLKRVISVLPALLLVAALVYLFWIPTSHLSDRVTETISTQYSQELSTQTAVHISLTLNHYYEELDVLESSLSLVEGLTEEKLHSFIQETEADSAVSYLAFADTEGYLYDTDGSYLGVMKLSWLGNLLNGETNIVSDNETIGQESYILIGAAFDAPIPMGEKQICAAIFGVTNDALSDRLVLTSDYSGGYSSIIDRNGSYIIKNPANIFGGLNAFSILSQKDKISEETLNALKSAMEKGDSYDLRVSGAGEDLAAYLYFSPVENTDWYMVTCLPGSFIENSIAELETGLSAFTAAVALLILLAAGTIILVLMISTRKLRKSRADLAEALQAAESASQAKTVFLSNMSHDIRTPLNAILGYTDMVQRHFEDTEKSMDALGKIKTASSHLLSLINDILEMSRIEAGRLEITSEPLDIRAAIAGVETMSQALAIPRSIDFTVEVGELHDPYIYADELHINEVLINLISNAIKYTPPGGKVCYRASQVGTAENGVASFQFAIIDNGIGMSEEYQGHLFEAFTREKTATVSKIEGAGLGLSIVKKIVDLAGGTISVSSKLGEGSTFIVTLPFKVMEEAAIEEFEREHQKEDAVPEDIDLTGKRVLLVDDNELNREIATEILSLADLVVETADDGDVAVKLFTEKGPGYYDFILMDIQMPVMDGYQASAAIRKLPGGESIPIVAVSANAFEEDKQKSLAAGMNAHIAKPIDIKALFEAMQKLA